MLVAIDISPLCFVIEWTIENEIEKMQKAFEDIQFTMLNLFEENGIVYKQLKRAVSTYPRQVQLRGFETLKRVSGMDFEDIFSLWNTELVWSFLDFTLLEHIVMRFGSDNLKDQMRQYSYKLQDFRKRTTVYRLIEAWPSLEPPQDYEGCEKAILTLNENARECTLEKLEVLRKRASAKLKRYNLSEAALVLFEVKPGSITLVWLLHNNTVQGFKEAFRECIAMGEFFGENNITKLVLAEEEIFPEVIIIFLWT